VTELITVCDDLEARAEDWEVSLRELLPNKHFVVERYPRQEFLSDLRTLGRRRAQRRHGAVDEAGDAFSGETRFDRSAVLIVDYDLFDFMEHDEFTTGDTVAYLARCYSTCGYIVGVNQDKVSNPFDLRLIGHPRSFVDLSIGSSQVASPGLWSDGTDAWPAFRPWLWPDLRSRNDALAKRARALVTRLDEPLREVVGLPPEIWASLGRNVAEWLEVPGEPEPTLRSWTQAGGMGMDPKDIQSDDELLARVAAARLMKWFEWLLLPRQDVLVDAPHLVERRPGVLIGDASDVAIWSGVTVLNESVSAALRPELAPFRVADEWLSRPVWLWSRLSTDPSIELNRHAARPDPAVVFAEDASRFIDQAAARQFVARTDSPFPTRWIAQVETEEPVQYVHAVRLAMTR